MKFTGEFFIPPDNDVQSGNHELQIEHMHRYYSIAPLAKGKRVLDIASGEGYGSNILAHYANRVHGVDINPELVAHASEKYGRENLSFLEGSAGKIPFPDGSMDMVVSFETIEHIDEDMQKAFIAEVKRVLKADGLFILSTPDRKNYSDRYSYRNEFHLHEFDREEFRGLLKSHFSHVNIFDQGFELTSVIQNEESYRSGLPYASVKINEDAYHFEGKYFIGLCSEKRELTQSSLASIIPESEKSYLQLIDTIVRLQEEIEKLGSWGHRSNEELEEARGRYSDLHQQYETFSTLNQELRRQLEEAVSRQDAVSKEAGLLRQELSGKTGESDGLRAEIGQLQIRADQLQAQVDELNGQISKQLRNIDHYFKSNYQLKKELDKKQRDENEKKEMESHRLYKLEAEKKVLEARLQDIYSSDGYKLLSIYYRAKDKFLPENSGRHLKLKAFGRFLKSNRLVAKLRGKGKAVSIAVSASELARDHNVIPGVPAGVEFPVVFPIAEHPLVTIVIPAYNNWAFTRNCLISIYQYTDDITYEVIVGDNVSTDETADLEKYFTNVVYLRNKENLGYIRNVNNAARHARGRFILTLNNDTTVTRNWLSSLVDIMNRDEKVGLVGSKLVYPNGSLQEAGGIIWKDASGWNYGREGNPDAPEYNYLKEVDYISGASNLIRREIWEKLNGLDERYVPAYFDDSDLAFSIRQLGYKTIYQPLSVVIHYEGMAHGTSTGSGTKKYQVVNLGKFINKWQAVLKDQFPNGENVFYARDRSKGKKTIVVIDHYVPHYDKDAGSRTTFQLLQLFVKLNYNVKFIGDNFYKHEPYTTRLEQMGIEVLYGEYYRDYWQNWILQNKKYIDYFYINRPHISIKYIAFLKEQTDARIVYYGHDLHYVRERLQYEIEKDPALLGSAEEWKRVETELIQKSDTVLTLSCTEKEIIEKEIGHTDVRIMPAFFYSHFREPVTNFGERKDLLFVGGFQHKPNVDAVIWFVKEVFPLITQRLKNIRFIIAGSNPPPEVTKLASTDIDVKGYISDEELNELYRNIRLVVVPLRYGAGVKGKTVETLYQGVPFVTTSFGIEGLTAIGDVVTAEDTAAGFAGQVIRLYEDEGQWKEASGKEVAYASHYFSEDTTKNIILNSFS